MKRSLAKWGIPLVAASLLLAACSSGTENESGEGLPSEIVIGVPLDTSGSAGIAVVGTDERNGIELAIEQVNESGMLGESKLKAQFVDTKAAPETAVQAVIDMTRGNKVDAIVGFTLSPSFLAAGPKAQEAEVPTVAVGLSGTGITEVGNYIFRVYPALVDFYKTEDPKILEALDAKRVAYFSTSDSSNIVEQHEFRVKNLEAAGFETVASETVTADAIDYTAPLTKVKNANPDVLVVNLNGGQDEAFLAALEQVGFSVPMVTDIGFGAPGIVTNPTAQCVTFTTTWDVNSNEGRNPEFVETYRGKFDAEPSQYASWGYDGIWILAEALAAADSADSELLRDALANLTGIEGALGVYDMGPDRTPTQPGFTLQVQDGKLVPWTAETNCQVG